LSLYQFYIVHLQHDLPMEAYNDMLSFNRSKSVYDYLVKDGVAREQINLKGFGYSKPDRGNDTEEGRSLNRRVEFNMF